MSSTNPKTERTHRLKKTFLFLFLFGHIFLLSSCFDDYDDVIHPASAQDIKNFVYFGLKQFYLYKDEDEVFDDEHFADSDELNTYLTGFDSPETLFQSLLSDQDRFSVIVPDFHKLEDQLNGITLNNGMDFGLVKIESSGAVFGYVRYVLPNTSAESQGVNRGMLFNRIDETPLTESNFSELLKPVVYTIGLAHLDAQNQLHNLDQSISLTKTEYTENPIFMHKTLDIDGHHIGYLMYNGFYASFDGELNSVFADFKTQGITDLVIDLRYNPGGSIETSKDLASMITGQFEGELFANEVFNDNFDDVPLLFDNSIRDGAGINSLHLNQAYILTTQSTASASELLINGLDPYIDVIQVGSTTVGKFQGSRTLYDSPDFSRSAVQPGHTYAMQPLILKTVNADGFTDFVDGLTPNIEKHENYRNLGQLGQADEPLLQRAIQNIVSGGTAKSEGEDFVEEGFRQIGESKMNELSYRRMYEEY